jgi:hypothetical protein
MVMVPVVKVTVVMGEPWGHGDREIDRLTADVGHQC